jgi:hypothetical protein
MNYFHKEIPVDRVHGVVDHRNPGPLWTSRGRWHQARRSFGLRPLRCPRAPAKGQEKGSEMWGVQWVAHRGASGGVAAGRRGGSVVVGKLGGGGVSAREKRWEKLGEG